MASIDIPAYLDYLPASLLSRLAEEGESVAAVPGLRVASGLREAFPSIETDDALSFACQLYCAVREPLNQVLIQRGVDRVFVDAQTRAAVGANADLDFQSPEYQTVIGKQDEASRVVVGPLAPLAHRSPVEVPAFLQGDQVTLFGPPDTAKLSINAMNALNRVSLDEPALVTELVEAAGQVPRWGADNEDSKTPIMRDFLNACENLVGCFDGSIRFEDPRNGKTYALDDEGLSKPIKRIPGLAMPDGNHLLDGNPLPLHLIDFALHVFHNWARPEAMVFYVPKLENEEEAAYFKNLIAEAERLITEAHPEYAPGTIKLFIVFENPRAIFRIAEIAEALAPHFLGGSLGWHDYLGSTARLFKEDPRYRIPVKADPNIVINHIKESHLILVRALEPIGGIKIGGMYGVLYEEGNPESYSVSMVGYIKDVVTQLKRGLDGFWVAHPAFVRTGLALVEATRRYLRNNDEAVLRNLITELVTDAVEREPLIEFVFGRDVIGLDQSDPLYGRAVLAASIEISEVIANHDPEEVRYNIFQVLQYITDWLSGNGCVALPATMTSARGDKVFVRIMDDLATTERSRWELWAEVYHDRVSVELFDQLLKEEVAFIRAGEDAATKRVQVRWEGEAARWYPIAIKLLRQLVLSKHPVEFAPELLLPFTLDVVRNAKDPWRVANELCPEKYHR